MQKKFDFTFSNILQPPNPPQETLNSDDLCNEIRPQKSPEIKIKYTRQSIDSCNSISAYSDCILAVIRNEETYGGYFGGKALEEEKQDGIDLKVVGNEGKVLNKKRSYAQYHLDLGQSDFLLHTCKVCGIMYAKGDSVDEKVHSNFHKNNTHGIPFKGWRHERVVDMPSLEKLRVVLVVKGDPTAQRKKVEECVKMMEIELGDGWILSELCKVYFYVSSQRIAGCVIAEPISAAHKVLSDTIERVYNGASKKKPVSKPTILHFGEICFHREVSRKDSSSKSLDVVDPNMLGSIVCEEESTPASCGIRAIWVSPSNRRKHIATHLLDTVRCYWWRFPISSSFDILSTAEIVTKLKSFRLGNQHQWEKLLYEQCY